jgi:hypothetical protein
MSLYRALNEEDVMKARFNLLDDGEYDAVVKMASRRMSQAGNVMADMVLSVFDENGHPHDVRDFLVFTQAMLWKIKHFCDSSGQEQLYKDDKFTPEDAAMQHVRIRLGRQIGNEIPEDKLNGKPYGSRYPDKNVVEDYIAGKNATPPAAKKDDFHDDLIPF